MNIDYNALSELFQMYDVLGLIAMGCPDDEYEPEVERIYAALESLPPDAVSVEEIVTICTVTYREMFKLTEAQARARYPEFQEIAHRLIAYFGGNRASRGF